MRTLDFSTGTRQDIQADCAAAGCSSNGVSKGCVKKVLMRAHIGLLHGDQAGRERNELRRCKAAEAAVEHELRGQELVALGG